MTSTVTIPGTVLEVAISEESPQVWRYKVWTMAPDNMEESWAGPRLLAAGVLDLSFHLLNRQP